MEITTSETLMLNFMIISVYHDLREQEEELEVPEVEEHAENNTNNDEIVEEVGQSEGKLAQNFKENHKNLEASEQVEKHFEGNSDQSNQDSKEEFIKNSTEGSKEGSGENSNLPIFEGSNHYSTEDSVDNILLEKEIGNEKKISGGRWQDFEGNFEEDSQKDFEEGSEILSMGEDFEEEEKSKEQREYDIGYVEPILDDPITTSIFNK